MLEPTKISLTDCTLQRKFKPFQNLALIILGGLWLIIILLLLIDNYTIRTIASYLILISTIPFLSFVLLSVPFLFIKEKGIAAITKDYLIINGQSYNINEVKIFINIENNKLCKLPIQDLVKKTPKWGNFLILNDNSQVEFIPSLNLKLFENIIGYEKRPALYVKTADLFDDIMSILWGAS
ncbi:hypothetical protein [Plebeiibacterium sediminum]|uniref:PH domain-containing protein n=1 Tax=Plebeiibacterium sediminum TaxID=2992112 RepID=A0AAE3M6Y1_9BACT|nr:hypothetical protein [Plebeiobacterium sediminum]MCW3787914.1 hypothetical protein [Plebeiobacterium sediminum]